MGFDHWRNAEHLVARTSRWASTGTWTYRRSAVDREHRASAVRHERRDGCFALHGIGHLAGIIMVLARVRGSGRGLRQSPLLLLMAGKSLVGPRGPLRSWLGSARYSENPRMHSV